MAEEILIRNPLEYFSHDAPIGFVNPKCFAVSPSGEMIAAVRIDSHMIVNTQTGEVRSTIVERVISVYHVTTGMSHSYFIDDNISDDLLRKVVEFYILGPEVVVLVSFNREDYTLHMFSLVLIKSTVSALLVRTQRHILPRLTYDLSFCFGRIKEGLLLVIGSRGPLDGEREVVGYSVVADPMKAAAEVDISDLISEFDKYLKVNHRKLSIFPKGVFWDENGFYFLLKRAPTDCVSTMQIGRLLFNRSAENRCCLLNMNETLVEFEWGLFPANIEITAQRGSQVWLAFTPPDYSAMLTYQWQIYLMILPYLIRSITWTLELSIRISRFDGGFTVKCLLKTLEFFFGPTMIPTLTAGPVFKLYNWDLKSMLIRRVEMNVPIVYTQRLRLPSFPVTMDCTSDGGLLFVQLPHDDEDHLNVKHYSPSDKPFSLARTVEHKAYRLFPALEKSAKIRHALGIPKYEWTL